MPETKTCPRCQNTFTCSNDDIFNCQCVEVLLNNDERAWIAGQFDGCLCVDCLRIMQAQYKARRDVAMES